MSPTRRLSSLPSLPIAQLPNRPVATASCLLPAIVRISRLTPLTPYPSRLTPYPSRLTSSVLCPLPAVLRSLPAACCPLPAVLCSLPLPAAHCQLPPASYPSPLSRNLLDRPYTRMVDVIFTSVLSQRFAAQSGRPWAVPKTSRPRASLTPARRPPGLAADPGKGRAGIGYPPAGRGAGARRRRRGPGASGFLNDLRGQDSSSATP